MFFMPIQGSYIDYARPFLRGSAEEGGDANNLAQFRLPTNRVAGDYAYACIHTENATLNTPAGWTKLADLSPGSRRYFVFGKILDGGEPDLIDCTHTGGTRRYASCTHVVGGHTGNIDELSATDTNQPNPPNNSAGAMNRNRLFYVSGLAGSNRNHTGYPNDLNEGREERDADGNTDSQAQIAGRGGVFGQSYNPGAFAVSGSTGAWAASTVIVW